jgi:DNA-binding transcriptional ArsR family regulator
MSRPAHRVAPVAPVFAALGDDTRLKLVARLAGGRPLSITSLSRGSGVTRQAVTKHLRVLAGAGLACEEHSGREHLWKLEPRRLTEAGRYLEGVSRRWDEALERLRRFVETA